MVVLISAGKRRGASEEEDVIDFCGQQLGGRVDGCADCGVGCEHCAPIVAGNANALSVAGIANFCMDASVVLDDRRWISHRNVS